MRLIVAFALLGCLTLMASNGLHSQDKKDPSARPALPANFDKLELTAEQKYAIRKVQAQYAEKIKQLQTEEREEVAKFLTPEQKKKLKDLADASKSDPKKDKK